MTAAITGEVHLYPRPEVPRLSTGERDHRWAAIREAMAAEGISVLLAPENTGKWDTAAANVRYLTGFGSNCSMIAAVLSHDRDVTAVTGVVPRADYWLQYQDWVTDIRPGGFDLPSVIIEALRDHGAANGRIGIAGLAGLPRQPDGLISHGMYKAVEEAFPGAELVDATRLLEDLRYVKSDEEVSFLERGVALTERAMEVFDVEARAGVPECVVYGRMIAAMVEMGGELPSMLLWCAGNPQPPTAAMMASQRPIGAGDIIGIELDGKWGGYLGHATHTAIVPPHDDVYRELSALQVAVTERCWEVMRPGRTLADLLEVCQEATATTGFPSDIVMHSRGLGQDAPVMVINARDDRTRNWPFLTNAVFVVKPRVSTPDGSRHVIWGDSVVVTADGARRLGSRPAGLTVLA